MNARTIFKQARRHWVPTMYGQRIILTVRLPLSLATDHDPMPPQPDLGEEWMGGFFTKKLPDGTFVDTVVEHVTGYHPTDDTSGPERFFVTPSTEYPGDEEWWEGSRTHSRRSMRDAEWDAETDIIEESSLTEEEVAACRVGYLWQQRYALGHVGQRFEPVADSYLRQFHEIGRHAKRIYGMVRPPHILVQYAFKRPSRQDLLRFCAVLAQTLRAARQAGIPARVLFI